MNYCVKKMIGLQQTIIKIMASDEEATITGMDIFPPVVCVELLPPKVEPENEEVNSHVQEEVACQERSRGNEGAC